MSYVIKTKKGWRPLLPAMQPTPPIRQWWSFPGAASYDAMFMDHGKDMRVTGNWYHVLAQRRAS